MKNQNQNIVSNAGNLAKKLENTKSLIIKLEGLQVIAKDENLKKEIEHIQSLVEDVECQYQKLLGLEIPNNGNETIPNLIITGQTGHIESGLLKITELFAIEKIQVELSLDKFNDEKFIENIKQIGGDKLLSISDFEGFIYFIFDREQGIWQSQLCSFSAIYFGEIKTETKGPFSFFKIPKSKLKFDEKFWLNKKSVCPNMATLFHSK